MVILKLKVGKIQNITKDQKNPSDIEITTDLNEKEIKMNNQYSITFVFIISSVLKYKLILGEIVENHIFLCAHLYLS